MPLRSPKMYFCIFGFQRFVWWPKCTPASSSSFTVNAAIAPPSSVVPPPGERWAPWPPHRVVRGVRDPRRPLCGRRGRSRGVLRVEPDVLLGKVARHDGVLAAAETEV